MGIFGKTKIGARDTRVTINKPINPNGTQGYYDGDGFLIVANDSQMKLWAKVEDRPSIGPIIGGRITNEVALGLMVDSRSATNVSILDTLTIDSDDDGSYQVIDKVAVKFKFTTMILCRKLN